MGQGLSTEEICASIIPAAVIWLGMTMANPIIVIIIGAMVGMAIGMYFCRRKCIQDNKDPDYQMIAKWSSTFAGIAIVYGIVIMICQKIPAMGMVKIATMVIQSPIGAIVVAMTTIGAMLGIKNRSDYCKDKVATK